MSFRLGSIPVRIHPWFWLTALLLGGSFRNPKIIAIWVAVVFVSVLVHELGHALAGMAFGLAPQIDLHGMGGTTSWGSGGRPLGHVRSIVVSVAGPLAGMSIALAIHLATRYGWAPENDYVAAAAGLAYSVNFYWGFLNLVPLLPLDGGNVMRSFLHLLTGGRGEKPARVISIIVAVLGLAYAVAHRETWLGFLAALFAFRNVQALRATPNIEVTMPKREEREEREAEPAAAPPAPRTGDPVADALSDAYRALEREDGSAAMASVRPLLAADSPDVRQTATRIFAYALLLEGQWSELLALLDRDRVLIGREELARYARTARQLGREDDATTIEGLLATA